MFNKFNVRLAPSRLFERRSRTNEQQSHEETTCLACMDSNLICILLAGNYYHDVMDALNEFSKPLFFEPLDGNYGLVGERTNFNEFHSHYFTFAQYCTTSILTRT